MGKGFPYLKALTGMINGYESIIIFPSWANNGRIMSKLVKQASFYFPYN